MKKKFLMIAMFVAMLAIYAVPVFALPAPPTTLDVGLESIKSTGLGQTDLRTGIGGIIKVALSFLGVIAIVIVLIGGFKYMTAGGKDEKTKDAKNWIISGIIGIAIILSAYAITTFVVEKLVGATGGTLAD
ncbi:hypothetical protein HY932_01800 [Candidatus Falkowbacteria bacterium]|nr:hypothetical protein [Candidatus Falkowbacteria bacterium]